MSFEHYLITRFNLPIFFTLRNGNKVSACSEEYLEHRFELFEKYCLPSVAQQSNKNFKWLILFDVNTPQKFKDRAEKWRDKCDLLHLFYFNIHNYKDVDDLYFQHYNQFLKTKGFPEIVSTCDLEYDADKIIKLMFPRFVKDCISKISKTSVDFILTTRLDNDDALHKNFIEYVQNLVQSRIGFDLINVRVGYSFCLQDKVVVRRDFGNSHFTTLIEPISQFFRTVYYYSHQDVKMFWKVLHVNNIDKPLFAELYHDSNVGNRFYIRYRGLFVGYRNFKTSDFGYEPDLKPSLFFSIKAVFNYNCIKQHCWSVIRYFVVKTGLRNLIRGEK